MFFRLNVVMSVEIDRDDAEVQRKNCIQATIQPPDNAIVVKKPTYTFFSQFPVGTLKVLMYISVYITLAHFLGL
jgi:hypothetical protein